MIYILAVYIELHYRWAWPGGRGTTGRAARTRRGAWSARRTNRSNNSNLNTDYYYY